MPGKIQPEDKIGPNNAGKMILRGCFMNVSQDWMTNHSAEVGGVLNRYLNNRQHEATAITLGYGDAVPPGRENGPNSLDKSFMASVVFRLSGLEKRGDALLQATAQDIDAQADEQIVVIREELTRYYDACRERHVEPMFTGLPDVIIANIESRTAVTHAQSMNWEDRDAPFNMFAGMTMSQSAAAPAADDVGDYKPPSFQG